MIERFEPLLEAARAVTGEFPLSPDGLSAGGVGAAILTAGGNVYTGICIDVSCGIGFCAEHAAIAEMLKHRETQIVAVVAVCEEGVLPPCGRCREFMMQIDRRNADAEVMVAEDTVVKLGSLLPFYWNG
ncbi:MAG: cytidine deaminase [Anaerolineae bacterium]|nr:cytidine deaminase [Anaerolineae bacterium]